MELEAGFDSLYTTENSHVLQQAQETHGMDSVIDLSMHTPLPDQSFLNNFNSGHNLFGQFSTIPMHEPYRFDSTSNVQTTPASPMGPPARPRKRKAPTLRAEDWEPVKSRTLELHISQGLPLPKVKKMIEDEFGFVAELRQYRTRISQWGKDKNIKSHEMSAIVRKRQHRKLIEVNKGELTFEVRGVPVEPQKIERWMKRNDVPDSLPYAPSPAASTPSAIACRTISECGSPATDSGYSPMVSVLSPNILQDVALSLGLSSPALSISSIVRPQSTSFAGASPAPIDRLLPGISFPTMGTSQCSVEIATRPTQHRYKQDEEERLRRELSKAELIYGTNHLNTLSILHELGEVLLYQGRYRSAEKLIGRELETLQLIHGNASPDTLSALDVLGKLLRNQGYYTQAEKTHRWTYQMRKKILGMAHRDTFKSMNNLGLALFCQARLAEAGEIHGEALTLRMRLFGEEDLDTLHSIHNLAMVYQLQGRSTEAMQMHTKTLSICRRLLGIENIDTLGSMLNLATLLKDRGDYDKAEDILDETLIVSERVLGREHPHTLHGLNCLASVYHRQGRLAEAEDLYLRVLEARKKVLGERHPHTLDSLTDLVSVYESQGRWAEASQLYFHVQKNKKSLEET